jgi:hypothetical protein
LEDLDIDVRIILKCILEKYDVDWIGYNDGLLQT